MLFNLLKSKKCEKVLSILEDKMLVSLVSLYKYEFKEFNVTINKIVCIFVEKGN